MFKKTKRMESILYYIEMLLPTHRTFVFTLKELTHSNAISVDLFDLLEF